MGIAGIDHVAVTVEDMDAALRFYCEVLGGEVRHRSAFAAGSSPITTVLLGGAKLNFHPSPPRTRLVARLPTPGAVDLCFRWQGTTEDALGLLARHGVAVVAGPEPRTSADGRPAQSLYFRDPDGNLLELLTTA
jgi:catechol 2,3-dioxygenase-like lactoylglutathione lyase family enzyme